MTLAVRGVVELYRAVGREKEVDREILAFSIWHDPTSVRIYGHYAELDGQGTSYYRHPIRRFDFTDQDGSDKWASYTFTKNVYEIWMPQHLERIGSAIDDHPEDLNFDLSQAGTLDFSSPVSRAPSEALSFAQSIADDGNAIPSPGVTPMTSVTQELQDSERGFKKPRKRAAGRQ